MLKQHLREEQDEFAARGESDHFFLCLKECSPGAIQYRLNDMIHDINNFHDTELPDLSLSFKQALALQTTRTRKSLFSRTMPGSHCKAAGQIYATAAVFMMKA